MTEINNTTRAGRQPQGPAQAQTQQQQLLQAQQLQASAQSSAQSSARRGPEPTRASANRLTGLGSGLNTDQTINTLIQVERRRLKPIEEQKATTLQELQAFDIVNQSLNKINATVEQLKGAGVWEGKLIESSNEQVVTATATTGAKPGKHTLVVDRLALNHQIASQGYETADGQVGTGKFLITVGEGGAITVVIDDSTNSLTGLKDAINAATKDVNATIIKTGSRTAPYQLVLTSQKTGSEGRIKLDVQLRGGTAPNFQNSVEAPSPWKGVGEAAAAEHAVPKSTGASTAIAQVIGDYTGADDNKFTFTAVQSGSVGGERQMQLRWQDEQGRSGMVNLDALHYAAGQPIEFVDGVALVFSEGDIIVNDSFSFKAFKQRSSLEWWVPSEDRPAHVSRPTAWKRQTSEEFGAPVIGGNYSGTAAQSFTLTVQGNGQVGRAESLSVQWSNDEDGQSGVLNVGQGYEPGTPLALAEGVTLTLKPGVLSEGQAATFDVQPQVVRNNWWIPDAEQREPSQILNVTNWVSPDGKVEGEGAFMPALPEGLGPRVSTAKVGIAGQFTGDEAKVYTFTAQRDGAIGTTKDLRIQWDDSKGNSGELSVGENYQPDAPLPFAEGLSVAFGAGRLFKTDSFTLRTRSATIQPPQDAKIRFGATELGGGLEITSPKNELDDVIDGVRLTLVSTSDKPVTITIAGDTKQAFDSVKTFVEQYDELAAIIGELTKYDKDNNVAGPLLGNRDLANIQNTLSQMLIDPVAGLPKSSNMLMALGITVDEKGLLKLDESVLQSKIQQDFAAVADLFRSKGESNNSNVAFAGMSDVTRISPEGYAVDVKQPATQGYYESAPLEGPIQIGGENNRFFVNVDGRQSDQLTLAPGSHTLASYARALQDAITNDKVVGQRRVHVLTEGNRLRVASGRYGSQSAISFVPSGETGQVGVGLMNGQSVVGTDVQGEIDGKPANGFGQLLVAPDKSGPAAGLRVFVKLSDNQLNPVAPEAQVVVTKGIASRVSTYLSKVVNPLTGDMRRIAKYLRDQVGSLDQQLTRMNDRIEAKRKQLEERFARLESQMSTLKQQQAQMQSQLGGMGGGGLPGLPGMPG